MNTLEELDHEATISSMSAPERVCHMRAAHKRADMFLLFFPDQGISDALRAQSLCLCFWHATCNEQTATFYNDAVSFSMEIYATDQMILQLSWERSRAAASRKANSLLRSIYSRN